MNKSIHLIIGDSFLVKEKSNSIVSQLEKVHKEALSKERFYLSESSIGEVLSQARTLPFLIEKQIFVIEQLDKLKKDDAEALIQYIEHPSPTTEIILCGAKIDKRSVFYKALVKAKIDITLFEEKDQISAGSRFINQKLKQFGKKIDPKAQRKLESMVGDAPSFLDSILTQLILYSGDTELLTEEMLDQFEEKIAGIDVFELTNAIASKRVDLALNLFNAYIEESGTDIFSLMGLLHWQLRRLWQARVYLDEGLDSASIARKCRISPRQSKFFFDQIRQLSRQKLEQAIEDLFLLDQGIKTGEAQDKMGLERWIVELTV